MSLAGTHPTVSPNLHEPRLRPTHPSGAAGGHRTGGRSLLQLRRLAAGILGAVGVLTAALVPAGAQDARSPSVSVAPTTLVAPGTDTPLMIAITPAGAIPKNSFLRLRGLPPEAALTEGHIVAPGAWAIPIVALPSLKVTAPASLQGRSQIEIALVTADGAVVGQTRGALVFAPPAPIAPPPPAAARAASTTPAAPVTGPAQPKAAPRPPGPQPESDEARKLRLRGEAILGDGNVGSARLFFERAASLGSGLAALSLARTYDAEELSRLKVVGMVPDPVQARRWYERARDLGMPEAVARLSLMGAR
jgi:hypothetical protein